MFLTFACKNFRENQIIVNTDLKFALFDQLTYTWNTFVLSFEMVFKMRSVDMHDYYKLIEASRCNTGSHT